MAETGNPQNIERGKKVSRKLDGLSERAKKSQLRIGDLIIPIGSFIALLLLSIFLFIPMINTAQENRAELEEVNEKIEHYQEIKRSLDNMDDAQLTEDIVTAKKIIPRILQVSDFVYYIDNLAQDMNLSTEKISARDVGVGSEDSVKVNESLGVSSPISYSGEYEDIVDFLDEIQGYSPYLVTLTGITLSKSGEDRWEVEFNLIGYYIPERELQANFDAPFTSYTKFSDVIDIFKVRVSRLNE